MKRDAVYNGMISYKLYVSESNIYAKCGRTIICRQ